MNNIIKQIFSLSLIISFSYNQNFPNGSFSLDQIFFQLNSLNIKGDLGKDSLNNGTFSLSLLKFGFDNINLMSTNSGSTELIINGPNFDLEDMEINTNYVFPNFYNLILSDLSDRRYETPMDGLEIIEKAIHAFKIKKGKYPKTYDDLIVDSFINTTKYPFNQSEWSYHLDIPRTIEAITTSMYKYEKKNLILDWETKKIINRESNQFTKEDVNWNFIFQIQDIKQHFLSDVKINMNPNQYNLEFYQRKGKFHINGININAIPNNDIFEQTIFKLKNLSLEINDLFLQLIKINGEPNIQNGKGNFTLKNFEIKLPPKLLVDETMKFIMQDLGIRNGLMRIRQLDFMIHFYDNEFGLVNASFISPFLKISLTAQISIDAKKSFFKSMELFDTELRINPISYGVRDIIREWEIDNNKNLNREGPVIVLKFSGPLSSPIIIGLD